MRKLKITVAGPEGDPAELSTAELRVDERHLSAEMVRQHGLIAWYGAVFRHHEVVVETLRDDLKLMEARLFIGIRASAGRVGKKAPPEKEVEAKIRINETYQKALWRYREAQKVLAVVQSLYEDCKQRSMTLHDLATMQKAEGETRFYDRADVEAKKRKVFPGAGKGSTNPKKEQ